MGDITKIFISSVNEGSLQEARNTIFDEFKELGHSPQMYEKTFGPWIASQDGITKCLEKVAECQMFILLIGEKGGTILEDQKRSVTHLEYIHAKDLNKYILVFCKKEVLEAYFKIAGPLIKRFVDEYILKYGIKPKTDDIFMYLKYLPSTEFKDPSIEYYTYFLIYNLIEADKVYIETISLMKPINWKEYFSDILRQGVILLPNKENYERAAQYVEQLFDYQDLIKQFFKYSNINAIDDWNRLLIAVRNQIKEIEVVKDYGYVPKRIGNIGKCTAICIFLKNDNKLTCITSDGDTDGNFEFELSDTNSLVVSIFNEGANQKLRVYYAHEKRIFYAIVKVNNYVISYHFKATEKWSVEVYNQYTDDIIQSMYSINGLVFDLVNLLIGRL